jgi:hypothetical protein
MTRLVRFLALFGVMVAAATAASTASAAGYKSCGDIGATQHVRAHGLTCFAARAVAERHSDTSIPGGACDLAKRKCHIDFFTCKRTFFGNSGTRITCSYDGRRVKFFYGM